MASTKIQFSLKVSGLERKSIAAAIGGSIDAAAKYTRVPACAYQIGGWTLDRESFLHSPELEESEFPAVRPVLSVLQAAELQTGGFLAVTIPDMEERAAENLGNILKSKQTLFKSALQCNTEIRLDGNVLSCFHAALDADTVLAYLTLTARLCDLAKALRYASPVERPMENQKYAFRCFLLRLGFIGKSYKAERKILLAPLEGNTAYLKTERRKEPKDDRISIKRTACIPAEAVSARHPRGTRPVLKAPPRRQGNRYLP